MQVSARRSRPLQLTWLDQRGRLRGVQGKQAAEDVDMQGTLSSHGTWIEHEVAMAGSCAWACNLMWCERLEIGDRCSLDGGRGVTELEES